jgi:hypothetical protein
MELQIMIIDLALPPITFDPPLPPFGSRYRLHEISREDLRSQYFTALALAFVWPMTIELVQNRLQILQQKRRADSINFQASKKCHDIRLVYGNIANGPIAEVYSAHARIGLGRCVLSRHVEMVKIAIERSRMRSDSHSE